MESELRTPNISQKRKHAAGSGHTLNQPMPGLIHHCFGCAPDNRQGLHLRFQENADGSVECVFRMPRRFEGPPGHLHGGIIAAVLDEAMGKVNRQKGIVALTRRMSIDYLQPVPLQVKLRAVGWPVKVEGRKHFHAGEIRTLDGVVLARSEGLFIAIDPMKMFEQYRDRLGAAGKNA
jgi:uncharacterized protein (TIGR00369 family)